MVTIKFNKKGQEEERGKETERHGKAEVHMSAERPLVSGYSYYGTPE
jgi:hypothetical protein